MCFTEEFGAALFGYVTGLLKQLGLDLCAAHMSKTWIVLVASEGSTKTLVLNLKAVV